MISLFLAVAIWSLNVYDARVVSVTDGDTVKVVVTLWVSQELSTSIRVRGVDTPETVGKCESERRLAQKAKVRVAELLPVNAHVTVSNIENDKYGGRYVADIRLRDGRSLSALLISEGLARAYDGGKKSNWCV